MKRNQTALSPFVLISATLLVLYVIIGLLVRVAFMFFPPADVSFGLVDILKFFSIGLVNDLSMGILLLIPLFVLSLGHNEWKYGRVAGGAILLCLLGSAAYVFFTHSVFHEYGGVVPRIAQGLITYKLASFALRFFIPSVRLVWRKATVYLVFATYLFLLLGNGFAEWFFWDEFGVRYNFIAVDYLVYTNEVVGNILESYAAVPLLLVLCAVLTVAIIRWVLRRRGMRMQHIYTLRGFAALTVVYLVLCGLSATFIGWVSPRLEGENFTANQVQQNGVYDFLQAFRTNKLDYDQFYAQLPEQECRDAYRELCGTDHRQLTDTIAAPWREFINEPAQQMNVVLVTVESLSASFLQQFGNEKGITPCLDSLSQHSLVFDSLYAVGNRTVRGLEALSLCVPPSAGASIVKRQDNAMGRLSAGNLLSQQGYQVQYVYGGDSYFDNMGDYFGHNGYEVIDRAQMDASKIVFSNIWGVSDEDLYRHALQVFDSNRQPFFAQLMTVSNHRPYTFPEGRIEFDGDPKCRDGAVKYTDYAIGRFIREARSHEWFNRTIFVIIADHCASSAGKTSIPVDKYHIPCIVYAPGLIRPCHVTKLCSQIDILPTLFAILGNKQATHFAGRNVLSADYRSRAFMATYQDLGYLEDGVLTVLSPPQKVSQFKITPRAEGTLQEPLDGEAYPEQARHAKVYYQYSNLYLQDEK